MRGANSAPRSRATKALHVPTTLMTQPIAAQQFRSPGSEVLGDDDITLLQARDDEFDALQRAGRRK